MRCGCAARDAPVEGDHPAEGNSRPHRARLPDPVGRGGAAQERLRGEQVTIEACFFRGEAQVIGVTDSIMYPGAFSFRRFEYPSRVPREAQERMADIVVRFARAIGFDDGIMNVEMIHDPLTGALRIVEVNPRMCAQFADLMEKVKA